VLVSRGETGLALFEAIATLPRRSGERRVLEQHRMCWDRPRRRGPIESFRSARHGRRRERRCLESVDGLVCVSRGLLAACCELAGLRVPVLVLPSGTALDPDPPGDESRDLDVLYAGKLRRDKGVATLVEAMAELAPHRLTVVGGTPHQQADLSEKARLLGVADRVDLVGHVAPGTVRHFHRRARVGVCPLRRGESPNADRYMGPMKILDMMATGTPIVASDVAPVRALVEADRTARLVRPNDPRALADGIRDLLCDRRRARALARAALDQAPEYAWGRRSERLLSFVSSLSAGWPTARICTTSPCSLMNDPG